MLFEAPNYCHRRGRTNAAPLGYRYQAEFSKTLCHAYRIRYNNRRFSSRLLPFGLYRIGSGFHDWFSNWRFVIQ
jgi:hypothetical protein